MILLTGHGALAKAISDICPVNILSVRSVDDNVVAEEFRKSDIIIHNAAGIKCDDYQKANVKLTRRLLHLRNLHNPKSRFVYISSMSFLDPENCQQIRPDMSDYARSKFDAETMVLAEHQLSVRFSTLFYKDPARDGLSALIDAAMRDKLVTLLNDGEDRRDWLPIDKAAEVLLNVIAEECSDIVTIASGTSLSFRDIAGRLGVEVVYKEATTHPVLCEFAGPGVIKSGVEWTWKAIDDYALLLRAGKIYTA